MLQDTRVACRLLQAVRLTVLPTGGECKEGVALRGGAACPVLAFNATELGFADAEAAASLGLAPGVMVGVTVALVTQGVSLEQSWASLWQNNLGAQRELNEIALNALAGYAKKVHAARGDAGAPSAVVAAAARRGRAEECRVASLGGDAHALAARRPADDVQERQGPHVDERHPRARPAAPRPPRPRRRRGDARRRRPPRECAPKHGLTVLRVQRRPAVVPPAARRALWRLQRRRDGVSAVII